MQKYHSNSSPRPIEISPELQENFFSSSLNFNIEAALASLELRALPTNVELALYLMQNVEVESLQEKEREQQRQNSDMKAEIILRNSKKLKYDFIPQQIIDNYEKFKYMYPGYGFETTDPSTMKFV